MPQVLVPAEFQTEHRQIIFAYLQRGYQFNRIEWRHAITAFDLLKNAAIRLPSGFFPFPAIYQQQVDEQYADAFINQLVTFTQIEQGSNTLWADIARKITPQLIQAGFYQPDVPEAQLLLAYCLYWWRSFTLGYALELEIQRDLSKSGIRFAAHDLRQHRARFSSSDLMVSGFKGDVKTSTYFLQAVRTQNLSHDFYITKIQGRTRSRTLVVFIQADMWQVIDGDTLLVLLEKLADTLPQAARIVFHGLELTVIDYEIWKVKMRQHQAKIGDQQNDNTNDI